MRFLAKKTPEFQIPDSPRERIDTAKIRGFDPTCGIQLKPGEHSLAKILETEKKVDTTGPITRMIWITKAMIAARMDPFTARKFLEDLNELAKTCEQYDDTKFIRYRDIGIEEVIGTLIDKFLSEKSRIFGMGNVVKTVKGKMLGEQWAVYYAHNCNADAIIWNTLLHREEEGNGPEEQRNAATIMRRNQIAIAGQQMLSDTFRSMLSAVLDTAFTISPHYSDEKTGEIIKAHGKQFLRVFKEILKSNDHIPLVAPEGRTTPKEGKEKNRVMLLSTSAIKGLHITPVDIEAPEHFLKFKDRWRMSFGPTTATVIVGEPFELKNREPGELVKQMYMSLYNAGARVQNRTWGYLKHKGNGQMEEKILFPKQED